jgi:hypothetical protein
MEELVKFFLENPEAQEDMKPFAEVFIPSPFLYL